MITVGYGDIFAHTDNEKILCIITMLVANGVFGYTISKIGNLIGNMDEYSNCIKYYYKKKKIIKKFL